MIYERNCFVVDGEEREKLLKVVGERYWNEYEDIYCIPVKQLTDEELHDLNFAASIRKFEYIIAERE